MSRQTVHSRSCTFSAVGSHCRQNLKLGNFYVVIWQTTSKKCIQGRAVRATLLFFLIQPIMFLICDIVVAEAEVGSETP